MPWGSTILPPAVVYRASLRANPRIFIPILAVPLLPAAGVLAIIYVRGLIGIVAAVAGLYFSYHLFKYLRSHLRSYIQTDDEGLRCRTTVDEEIAMAWSDITHGGLAVAKGKQATLFLYAEGDDKLLTIPPEYQGWEQLVEEARARVDLPQITLSENSTIQDHLRAVLGDGERD
jgi:hypothetical protein